MRKLQIIISIAVYLVAIDDLLCSSKNTYFSPELVKQTVSSLNQAKNKLINTSVVASLESSKVPSAAVKTVGVNGKMSVVATDAAHVASNNNPIKLALSNGSNSVFFPRTILVQRNQLADTLHNSINQSTELPISGLPLKNAVSNENVAFALDNQSNLNAKATQAKKESGAVAQKMPDGAAAKKAAFQSNRKKVGEQLDTIKKKQEQDKAAKEEQDKAAKKAQQEEDAAKKAQQQAHDEAVGEIVITLGAPQSDLLAHIRELQDLQDLQKDEKNSREFENSLTVFQAATSTKISEDQISDVIAKLRIVRNSTWTGKFVNAILHVGASIAQVISDVAQYFMGSSDKTVELAAGKAVEKELKEASTSASISEKASVVGDLSQANPGATSGERVLYRIVENVFSVQGIVLTGIGGISFACKEEIIKIIKKALMMMLATQNNNNLTDDEKKKAHNEAVNAMIADIGTVVIVDKTGADVDTIVATGIAQGDRSSLGADAQSIAMSAIINSIIASLSSDDNAGYVYDKKAVGSGNYTSNLDKIQQQHNKKKIVFEPYSSSQSLSEPSYDFSLDDSSPSYDYSSIYPSYQELLDMEREHNASLAS